MLAAVRRCGSRVEFSATTANVTSPGCRNFTPSLREISLQCGGKMEETRTRFCAAMPASLSASSKDVSLSLCFPTPLVRKMRLGTMSNPNLVPLQKSRMRIKKNNTRRRVAVENFQEIFLSRAEKRRCSLKFSRLHRNWCNGTNQRSGEPLEGLTGLSADC